jgi:Putative Zn-dependent protease, contains TPR repeats
MLSRKLLIPVVLSVSVSAANAQVATPTPSPKAPDTLQNPEITREKREQAYAKLLEGQRYIWQSNPGRGQAAVAASMKSAKAALQRSVELDPALAEGYTALAELTISAPPGDIDEAINLALIATKVQPDNFGGHRILARLYTYKSQLHNGVLVPEFAAKAIAEWKEIARLDPRNAEAWAFLSELFAGTGKTAEQINALQKWVASATPLDTQFYSRVMGGRENLSPDNASLKLGTALIKAGRSKDAIGVLAEVIADEPDNAEALDLLREAVETSGPEAGAAAVTALQQAVFANPGNTALVTLLAQVEARQGNVDDAAKMLRDASAKLVSTDKQAAASVESSLGDVFAAAERTNEAIAAYEKAMSIRGIKDNLPVADHDREFVMGIFEKMIHTYKVANRPNDVKAVILRARKLLGKDDLFADRQLIMFYRESGDKELALRMVREVRLRVPNDYGFLRLEASALAELGQVDKAVALIRGLSGKKTGNSGIDGASPTVTVVPSVYDDFSNQLFISQLYTLANRPKDAAATANQAYSIAKSEERKQLAKLTLATAQQMGGDYAAAETTLRDLLKQTPGNPIALNNLGYFLLERNERISEAIEMIKLAVKIDPTNPSYLDSLGWGYFKSGNFADAEQQLRTAARLDPGSATIQEHLADVYEKQGKADLAKSVWQRALILASDAADVQRLKTKLAGTK